MKAERCPVCYGDGKYNGETCHGCNGKGWVEAREDYIPYIPYPVYPQPEPYYPYNPWYPNYPYYQLYCSYYVTNY